MRRGNFGLVLITSGLLILMMPLTVPAQTAEKPPLTNQDVIKMVRAGLSESIVVATIQENRCNYDTSPDGLIALQKAGVTPKEMDAMMSRQQGATGGGARTDAEGGAAGADSASSSGARWEMPSVTLLRNAGPKQLKMEKTNLAETKQKPRSLASLAGDSAATEGMQAGVNDAAWDAASHSHSWAAGTGILQGGGILNGALGRRQPMVTYVWGVPGPVSANVLQTSTPKFSVNFAKAPGVNPSEFAPEIVKLTPTQNNCRLVGATQGKEDARSRDAADWEIFSSFVEDRVAVNSQNTTSGQYELSPQSPLLPGEYAVVLRPVSKSEKFSGGDVARAQGPGLMFDVLWSFQVADTAK